MTGGGGLRGILWRGFLCESLRLDPVKDSKGERQNDLLPIKNHALLTYPMMAKWH